MITENMKAMCQSLGDMAHAELDPNKDTFILYTHSETDNFTAQCCYGNIPNLATGFIQAILRYLSEMPKEMQRPTLGAIQHTLWKMWRDDNDQR